MVMVLFYFFNGVEIVETHVILMLFIGEKDGKRVIQKKQWGRPIGNKCDFNVVYWEKWEKGDEKNMVR